MKFFVFLLLTAMSIQAAIIDLEDTKYNFEYNSETWDFLSKGEKTKGLWPFSDHLLYLGACVVLFDAGRADKIIIKEIAQEVSEAYDKMEEMKPIAGLHAFKFTQSKDKNERWLCYLLEEKYTLFIFVEGDVINMTLRESAVRSFLSGIRKKQ